MIVSRFRLRRTAVRVASVATAMAMFMPGVAPTIEAVPVWAQTDDELEVELENANTKVDTVLGALVLTERDIKEAAEELQVIEARLLDARGRLRIAEGQLALAQDAATDAEELRRIAEAGLSEATALLTSAQLELDAQEDILAEQVTTTYKYGGSAATGNIAVRLMRDAGSAEQLAHSMYQLSAILDHQEVAVSKVAELRSEYADLRVDAARAHDTTIVTRREAAASLSLVTDLAESAQNLEAAVRADRSRQTQLLSRLERDASAKRVVLASLETARDEVAGEIRRRQLSASALNGVVCLNIPGDAWFQNDWGFPRSGGRTHKGTDVFADRNAPVYAIKDGTIKSLDYVDNYVVGSGRGDLGGITASYWVAPNEYWYMAHLEKIEPSLKKGDKVVQGQLIGWTGNSGNAKTTPTHTHVGRYVNGVAQNPYPTLAPVCL